MSNNDFQNLQDEILQRFNKAVEEYANKVALILRRQTKQVLIDNRKIATGDLEKSISSDVRKITAGYVIRCFANVKYAVFVHEGTRPHFPPIESIAKWIRTKRLTGRYSIKTHTRLGSKVKQAQEDRSLAFAIARSIAKKGTIGLKFFDIALKQAWPEIQKQLSEVGTAKL